MLYRSLTNRFKLGRKRARTATRRSFSARVSEAAVWAQSFVTLTIHSSVVSTRNQRVLTFVNVNSHPHELLWLSSKARRLGSLPDQPVVREQTRSGWTHDRLSCSSLCRSLCSAKLGKPSRRGKLVLLLRSGRSGLFALLLTWCCRQVIAE